MKSQQWYEGVHFFPNACFPNTLIPTTSLSQITLPHLYPESHVPRMVYPGTRTKENLDIMMGIINPNQDYLNSGKMQVGKHVFGIKT